MGAIFAPMTIFIEYPWLALLLGVLLLGLGRWRGRRVAVTAGGLWLLYGLYETGMRLRWLCSGECNIRVDLLLVFPVLLITTLVAVVRLVRGRAG